LSLAENDRNDGTLEEVREEFILGNTREVLEELGNSGPEAKSEPISILSIPAKDLADELCAIMLVQLLAQRRIRATVLSVSSLSSEYFDAIRTLKPSLVCISALPPGAFQQARLFCKSCTTSFPS
jgi:hypothetical protein